MSRAQLAEELKKLLPNESDKRIRQAIMKAYGGAASVAVGIRDTISADNRLQNGILVEGSLAIPTPTSANVSGWAWVVDFAIQEGTNQTIPVIEPDDDYARIDFFHGDAAGVIHYTPGILDENGNSLFPVIPNGNIILKKVLRNTDGTNDPIDIPIPEPILNFTDDDIIPVTRNSRLENSEIRVIRSPEGEIISYLFPKPVKGVPAQEPDEFVTLQQLPQQYQYGRLFGGDVQWSETGLTYNISAVIYALQGIKTAPSGQITLAPAHPTLPRFDIYGWNLLGQLFYRAGTPADNPFIPSIDPATEVMGTPILLPAGAIVPDGVFNTIIYAERLPGEWTPSFTGLGTANFESTANPKAGTKSIEVTSMQNGSTLTLMAADPFNFADFETFGMDLALKAPIFSGHNLTLTFIDGSGAAVSNSITILINKALLSYQFVGLNLNSISKFQPTARGIRLTFVRVRGSSILAGYHVDNIKLQGGVQQPEEPVNSFPEAPTDGKTYGRKNSAWVEATEEAPTDSKEYARKNATWVEVTGGGSGPSPSGLALLDTFPVLKFDKNYRFSHQMIGAVNITLNGVVSNFVSNYNIIYIQADGTNKPTFSSDFTVIYDGWNNTVGKWNRLRFEYTPAGKAIVQIYDTAGDTSPGSGATAFNLLFDDDYNFQHVISGTVHLTANSTGAEYAKKTIFYFMANGVNKPTWAAPIEANFDNYVNTAGVWNRFYLEWTPENKVTLQIHNT